MDELREKVTKGLEACIKVDCQENACPYALENECRNSLERDALELLKAQELPPVKPEKLAERTTKWLDNMTAEERLKEIAVILDDWDGYRTAKGLGMLINEVWAYTLYPVKVQEPVEPEETIDDKYPVGDNRRYKDWHCGKCKGRIPWDATYCPSCGQAVKWDE